MLELGVAAVKRRRFTKTHATLSDKTCSGGENSSACLSSNIINQSTSLKCTIRAAFFVVVD